MYFRYRTMQSWLRQIVSTTWCRLKEYEEIAKQKINREYCPPYYSVLNFIYCIGLTNRSQHNSRSQEKGRGKSHLWRQKWKATLGAKYDSSWLYKSFEYEGQSSYSAIQSPLFLFRLCEVVELYFTDLVCKREWGVTQKPYSLSRKGGYHSTPWLSFPWNLVLPLDVVAKIYFGVKHIGINLFCVTLLKQSNRYTRKCTSISDSGLIMVTFFRITLTQWYIVLLMDSFCTEEKNSRRSYIQRILKKEKLGLTL